MKADEKHIWMIGHVERRDARQSRGDADSEMRIVDIEENPASLVTVAARFLLPQWLGKKVRVIVEVVE